jgi:uncharacterized protein YkwD
MIRSATLVLVLAAALVVATPASNAAAQAAQRDSSLERAVVEAVNAVRVSHGLRPLTVSRGLRAAAFGHTNALAAAGLFQHESPDGTPFDRRLRRVYPTRGFSSWSAGENLVFGSAPFSAADTVRAWLESPPHRRNLLSRTWRDIGVGAVLAQNAGGDYGDEPVVIVTADFGVRSR